MIWLGRRTPKGHLKLELTKTVDAATMCHRIQAALGEKQEVKLLQTMAELAIRRVDHLAKKSHTKEALQEALQHSPSVASIRIKERRDANQDVKVRLPVREAAVVLNAQKLRMQFSSFPVAVAPRL
uniref:Uncharacterized protein n=1 Tax=Anopheles farauti TaxID=69004 RepID=A0A182Q193_9DIPT